MLHLLMGGMRATAQAAASSDKSRCPSSSTAACMEPQLDVRSNAQGAWVLTLTPPEQGAPPKLDVCIVIDT